MKRTWFILLLCIQALGITARSNKELYKTLDSLISCYDKLTAEKEQRINSIKQSMEHHADTRTDLRPQHKTV